MPFTNHYDFTRLSRESEAFETKYRSTRYEDIPKDELRAQRDREVAMFAAATPTEQQAILDINNDSFGKAA